MAFSPSFSTAFEQGSTSAQADGWVFTVHASGVFGGATGGSDEGVFVERLLAMPARAPRKRAVKKSSTRVFTEPERSQPATFVLDASADGAVMPARVGLFPGGAFVQTDALARGVVLHAGDSFSPGAAQVDAFASGAMLEDGWLWLAPDGMSQSDYYHHLLVADALVFSLST
jgi:hypothetical protein